MNRTSDTLKKLRDEPYLNNRESELCSPIVIAMAEKAEQVMAITIVNEQFNALLVNSKLAYTLSQISRQNKDAWFGTTQAAFYCALKSKRYDLNWASILQENRRSEQLANSVMGDVQHDKQRKVARRGNRHKLGGVDYTNHKGSVYYSLRDINRWLHSIDGKLPCVPPIH